MIGPMAYDAFVLGAVAWLIAGCLWVGGLALRDLMRLEPERDAGGETAPEGNTETGGRPDP